jgi:hypothetical protein
MREVTSQRSLCQDAGIAWQRDQLAACIDEPPLPRCLNIGDQDFDAPCIAILYFSMAQFFFRAAMSHPIC